MIYYTDLIGIPFVSHGRDAKKGLDCYGLLKELYFRKNIKLEEYYIDAFDSITINKEIMKNKKRIDKWEKVTEPHELDVICFKFNCDVVNHVGCYIGDGKFIHTRQKIGVNVDNINSPAWKRRIDSIYKYRR